MKWAFLEIVFLNYTIALCFFNPKKMKKYGIILSMFIFLGLFATACGTVTSNPSDESAEIEGSVDSVSVETPFADIQKNIMTARKEYSVFKFVDMEGSCLEMGLPTNLVYKGSNMVMTEDEKYFDQGTAVDVSGTIRFRNFPLNTGNANCSIKTTKGINTATLSCKNAEGEDMETEVCNATFKVMAVK